MPDPLIRPRLHRPWLTWQTARIAGAEVVLMRVSFAGELGWEIHSRLADTPQVWAAVMAAGQAHGLKPFGMFALNALRIEKGYRAWKGDLSTDYTVLQGGLERFVDWSKPEFRGKAALEAERQAGPRKRFVTLRIEAGDFDPPYMSTLWSGGTVVGEVRQWRLMNKSAGLQHGRGVSEGYPQGLCGQGAAHHCMLVPATLRPSTVTERKTATQGQVRRFSQQHNDGTCHVPQTPRLLARPHAPALSEK